MQSLTPRSVSICGVINFANISVKTNLSAKTFFPVYQGPRWVSFKEKKCQKISWHCHLNTYVTSWARRLQPLYNKTKRMSLSTCMGTSTCRKTICHVFTLAQTRCHLSQSDEIMLSSEGTVRLTGQCHEIFYLNFWLKKLHLCPLWTD